MVFWQKAIDEPDDFAKIEMLKLVVMTNEDQFLYLGLQGESI